MDGRYGGSRTHMYDIVDANATELKSEIPAPYFYIVPYQNAMQGKKHA